MGVATIIELKKYQYSRVKKLLTDVDIQIICLGVINQDINGMIWVDDSSNPRSAMIADNIWAVYLLGDSDNKIFNQQTGEIIRNYIIPKRGEDTNINREWILVSFSDSWISKIETELQLFDWFFVDIWHYKLGQLKQTEWRNFIPAKHKVEKVNEAFLSKTYFKNHKSITNWIHERWKNTADFFQRGVCFCLIKEENQIVSWSISDWATENYMLLGITTDEKYRRLGYASLVTAASAEYCKSKGLDARWFCGSSNIGSWKTAEKVGFQKIKTQKIIIGKLK